MKNNLDKLQKNLGYKFKDPSLLAHAMEHKSTHSGLNNERLEFLGDAVLDLVVGEYLFKKFKNHPDFIVSFYPSLRPRCGHNHVGYQKCGTLSDIFAICHPPELVRVLLWLSP